MSEIRRHWLAVEEVYDKAVKLCFMASSRYPPDDALELDIYRAVEKWRIRRMIELAPHVEEEDS